MKSCANVSTAVRLATATGLSILGFGVSVPASAVERVISSQTAVYSCGPAKPGDVLTIPSGTRGPLIVRDCNGTASNPIIVRNDPGGNGPAIIRRASGSGGFILSCINCIGVTIDGSNKWNGAPSGKTYGIKVTVGSGSPSAFVRLSGMTRSLTVRGIEVDGAGAKVGSGIRLQDLDVKRSRYPGVWREDILIENNYVHDVANEGMYIGPNYSDGALPLRNIEIRSNRVEDIGWEGINAKSMWEGRNLIHHNEVRRAGKNAIASKPAQYTGINVISSTVKVYNNWVETTGMHGIQVWSSSGPKASEGRGPFIAEVWNNVIVDAGALWKSFMLDSSGINIGASAGLEKPNPRIYSNTIVNPRKAAISIKSNAGSGFIRDNIAAGAGSNPVITAPNQVQLVNNEVGSVAQLQFVDPTRKDFRLKTGSPARNQGSSTYPDDDFDNVSRPKGGSADRGAFEATN